METDHSNREESKSEKPEILDDAGTLIQDSGNASGVLEPALAGEGNDSVESAGVASRVRGFLGMNKSKLEKETLFAIELHRYQMRVRIRIALFACGFLVLGLAVLAWYPRTPAFANRFDRMMVETMGAKPAIVGAEFTPFRGRAVSAAIEWPEDATMKRMEVEQVTAHVNPFRYLSKRFGGDELRVEKANLVLRVPFAGIGDDEDTAQSSSSTIHFSRMDFPALQIGFEGEDESLWPRFRNLEAVYYPTAAGGVPRALFYSGLVEFPQWTKLHVERGIVDFHSRSAKITGFKFYDSEARSILDPLRGVGDLSGNVSYAGEACADFQFSLQSFLLEALIGESMARIMNGRVDSADASNGGEVSISPESGFKMSVDLALNPRSSMVFGHFPFVGFLAMAFPGDSWYRAPTFDQEATFTYSRKGGTAMFENIRLTARNRMAIRGSFMVDEDGMIAGDLEVGLSPGTVESAPTRRLDGMFSPERDQFRWVNLELSGSLDAPIDNFNSQFIETPLPEIALPTVVEPQRDGLEETTVKDPPSTSGAVEDSEPSTVLPLIEFEEDD